MCSQLSLEMLLTDICIVTVRIHRSHTRNISIALPVISSKANTYLRRKPGVLEVQKKATHPQRALLHKEIFTTFPHLEELQRHCRCSVFSLVAKEKALSQSSRTGLPKWYPGQDANCSVSLTSWEPHLSTSQ